MASFKTGDLLLQINHHSLLVKKMLNRIKEILSRRYPRNYIVKKPYMGMLFFLVLIFCYLVVYRPLGVHNSRSFDFPLTMLLYSIGCSVFVLFLALLIKQTNCFSKNKEWTFGRELLSDVILLLFGGIVPYLLGPLIEGPSYRWNLPTFSDSFTRAVLIGCVPILPFTLLNFRYLYTKDIEQEFKPEAQSDIIGEQPFQIISQLKRENLKFYPNHLLFAESEGNYVAFYILKDGKVEKSIIRNSISNIEEQLSVIPFFIRTHRAFIVNVKQVRLKKGNSLGYRLKLSATGTEIPVSRQNISRFDEVISQFK